MVECFLLFKTDELFADEWKNNVQNRKLLYDCFFVLLVASYRKIAGMVNTVAKCHFSQSLTISLPAYPCFTNIICRISSLYFSQNVFRFSHTSFANSVIGMARCATTAVCPSSLRGGWDMSSTATGLFVFQRVSWFRIYARFFIRTDVWSRLPERRVLTIGQKVFF